MTIMGSVLRGNAYPVCVRLRNQRQRVLCEYSEKSFKGATLSIKHPLFLVFTIVECNGFCICIGTVDRHPGDRAGPGVDRVGRGAAGKGGRGRPPH